MFLRGCTRVEGKLACRRYRIDGKRKRVRIRLLTWHYVVELDGFVFLFLLVMLMYIGM